jgi:hypothetical protein
VSERIDVGFGTSRLDVIRELAIDPNEWHRALDLQMVVGGNRGIRASIQSISNALRHAYQAGLILRRHAPGCSGNVSEWKVNRYGLEYLRRAEPEKSA